MGQEIRRIIASNIRKLRIMNSLTQEQLAFKCDLHRTYISSVEREQRNLTVDNLEVIATALSVKVMELLKEGEEDE